MGLMKSNRGEDSLRFQFKAMRLIPFEEQFPFADCMGRKFRSDFAFIGNGLRCAGVLIEVSGGLWIRGGGAHSRPAKIELDMERQQYAALLGFFMMPFTPLQVDSGFALEWTKNTLIKLGWNQGASK